MQDRIINVFKNFREKIYNFFSSRRDASFELVDSLSSNISANSVSDLSLNPVHRRNYCSITRVVDEFYPEDCDKKAINDELTKILSEQCFPPTQQNFYLFGVDCTPNPRRYAPTQQDRGFVYAPNTISGNKPVTIGHQYSIAAYFPEKIGENNPPWILPLACHRVTTDEKGALIGMQQITQCLKSQEKFKNKICVVAADSAYSSPECLVESAKNPNQVQVSRVRSNRVFHYQANEETDKKIGRKKQFGDQFKLKDETTWREPDEKNEFTATTKKGKKQIVKIKCWNSIIMRGKNKAKTSNHPFRLVQICVYKESGKLFFKKPLWLMISGENRLELSLQNIFDAYRQRFDIEHFFRFGKNKLLMDKSQTPDVEHEEAGWQLVMIAYTQLYLARDIAKNAPKPWEKYLETFKSSDLKITPTQVQKDFGRIIQMFGTPALPPKRLKNALGRQKGEKQVLRTRYPVVQKSKVAQPATVLA
jgi:DDE superfamily endonuclease